MPEPAARSATRGVRARGLGLAALIATVTVLIGTAVVGSPAPANAVGAASGVTVTVADTTARPDGTVPFSTSAGWLPSALTSPEGGPSLYTLTAGATATWTLPVSESAVYHLEAGIPAGASAGNQSRYAIEAGGDSHQLVIDQAAYAGTWVPLGEYALDGGDLVTVSMTAVTGGTGTNTRAASVRLVADNAIGGEFPYLEDFADGLDGWTAISGDASLWSAEEGDFPFVHVGTLTGTSGTYLRPDPDFALPEAYVLNTTARVNQTTSNGTLTFFTDMISPYSASARHTATQFMGTTVKMAQPNSGLALCTGASPVKLGEWFQLQIARYDDIMAVRVNGDLVASVPAAEAGGTIGFGAYKADADIGGIGIEELSERPADFPDEAGGCGWVPNEGPGAAQPVIANQSGYNVGQPMRFTAPKAEDGAVFEIVDDEEQVLLEGTVHGGTGDFSDFAPTSTGPFTIRVHGADGDGESWPFGVGADWIERVSYENAIDFMTEVRCFNGELAGKPLNGTHAYCGKGLGWRDSHQMSYEIPTLIDFYFANPSAVGPITNPEATYSGLQYPTAEGAPEAVRLIAWGAEVYLRGEYNHTLIKEQLAAFLWAYPELSEWIPVELYEDVRDYLFPLWDNPEKDRYAWADFTEHTADLTQVYTQIGTGKGEFPLGHSVVPNLQLWQVAEREQREDAHVYLDAAIAQAQWIVDNVDPADPTVTKGQRQAEYHLMTGFAKLLELAPEGAVHGVREFASQWADTAIERSDNMWDFRRYDDERWTIPPFRSFSGVLEDPNETGNLLGFPAAALATTQILGDDPRTARLVEIAVAQVDDIFGRNPTGRAATFRATREEGFEGLDVGWYSEYQGGVGRLQGVHGVFDGSPKNAHYPFNPGIGNIGHTEGWVAFNTAWIESLAWRAYSSSSIAFDRDSAPADGTATVTLRAPLNMEAAGGNTGEVRVTVDGDAVAPIQVTQTGVNALDYTAEVDLLALGAHSGDTITVSHGVGPFARTASLTVTAPTDDSAPVIAGLPADSALLKDSDPLTLAVEATDPESGIDGLEVTFDGAPVAPDAEIDLAGKAGTHTLRARAVNGAGLVAEASVTIHVFADTNPVSRPGRGTLSNNSGHAYGLHDGTYDVAMNLWWGTPGAAFRLFENGVLVATEVLEPTWTTQATRVSFAGKPNGTYVYTAELVNALGATATTSTTVEVVDAAPGAPTVSHDDWDGDGSFTATANLWWGTNATSYRFELDGAVVGSGELEARTPDAQRATVQLDGVSPGTHTLVAVFANSNGETASKPVTVTVR